VNLVAVDNFRVYDVRPARTPSSFKRCTIVPLKPSGVAVRTFATSFKPHPKDLIGLGFSESHAETAGETLCGPERLPDALAITTNWTGTINSRGSRRTAGEASTSAANYGALTLHRPCSVDYGERLVWRCPEGALDGASPHNSRRYTSIVTDNKSCEGRH
jgi:hypothetical protein